MDIYLITPLGRNGWLFTNTAKIDGIDFFELEEGRGVLLAVDMSEEDLHKQLCIPSRAGGPALITRLSDRYGNLNKTTSEWISSRRAIKSASAA